MMIAAADRAAGVMPFATVLRAHDGRWAVVRAGEPIPATGPCATNAAAWESLDGPDPSRGERVAQWAFEQNL
jgi:hypothetical protein